LVLLQWHGRPAREYAQLASGSRAGRPCHLVGVISRAGV